MGRKFDAVNEQIVLASMAQNGPLFELGVRAVEPDDFLGDKHKVIFAAMRRAREIGLELKPKNLVLLSENQDCGGLEYLEEIFGRGGAAATTIGEFTFHLDRLRQMAIRFRAARRVKELDQIFLDQTRTFDECELAMHEAGKEFSSMARVPVDNAALMDEWMNNFEQSKRGERRVFQPTGLESLDSVLTEGFAKGGLTVIAGRPRMGKSVVMTDLVRRSLLPKDRPKILVIPFEKGKHYFLNMLIASLCKVQLDAIIKYPDELTESEEAGVRKAAKWVRDRMEDSSLTVLDSPVLKMLEDESWNNRKAMNELERVLAAGGYELAFFDLMERALSTSLESQQIALALMRAQSWCPKLGMHLVITQQLSRRAEDFKNTGRRRPSIIDLKNSGAYEEIPDTILLIHREKIFKPLLGTDIVELRVAKQKLGDDGMTVLAEFAPAVCRLFKDRLQKPGEITDAGPAKGFAEDE